jgi:uncharacterized membrane protein YhhN
MPVLVLSPLVILAAFVAIRADYRGPRWQHYLGKPLATVLIIVIALSRAPDAPRVYAVAIVVGLLCSLAGDIFLMLPADRFIAGLVSFLLAHLAYIVAFSAALGAGLSLRSALLLLPLLLYGATVFRRLLPHLGALAPPVLVYMLVIVAMAWRALDLWAQVRTIGAFGAALGTILFVASDSLLALNRFVGKFAAAPALILGTYYAAQWLIALSV